MLHDVSEIMYSQQETLEKFEIELKTMKKNKNQSYVEKCLKVPKTNYECICRELIHLQESVENFEKFEKVEKSYI